MRISSAPQFKNLAEVLQSHAIDSPMNLACKFYHKEKEESYNFSDLDKHARKVAVLLQRDCDRGDRVLLLIPVGLKYIAAFWGCVYAGVLAVPAYPPHNKRYMQGLQAIIDDADAKLILTTVDVQENVYSPLKKVNIDDALVFQEESFQSISIQPEDTVFLQYTSGSTGKPKGVMVSHKNLLNNLEIIANIILSGGEIRVCSWLPPFHDMGLIGGILLPAFACAPTFLMNPGTFLTNPLKWLEIISQERVTASPAPNFAYDLCVKAANKCMPIGLDLSSWKVAWNGAEPVCAETISRFSQTFARFNFAPETMTPCYGMAESTLITSCKKTGTIPKQLFVDKRALEKDKAEPIDDLLSNAGLKLISCGQAVTGHKIIISDPTTYQPLPEFHVGEICIAGSSITSGYWQKPELNAAVFVSDPEMKQNKYPYFRTGDLGFLDQNGEIYITGRMKDLIIIRGRNLYPQDIEACVVASHASLISQGTAAFGMEIENQEQLIIVQEISRHQKEFASVYAAILQNIFEEFEINPVRIVLIQQSSLPKTSSGKVQRRYCRQLLLEDKLRILDQWQFEPSKTLDNDADAPQSIQDVMGWMCEWVEQHIGVCIKDVSDLDISFASLGFDSMRAHQLCEDLSRWLEIDINRVSLWHYPTISKFADYVYNDYRRLTLVENVT